MTSAADRVMRIYDEHVPGAREAYKTDPTTHYARKILHHILAVAEIAMRTEQIPEDVRFRILMTMAVGQPSTPVDAEQRLEMTKKLIDAQTLAPMTYLLPPDFPGVACARCHDRGYVPDFSRGLDAEFGEPGKKPCPDCQPGRDS